MTIALVEGSVPWDNPGGWIVVGWDGAGTSALQARPPLVDSDYSEPSNMR
jgi:hypothetical protein